jgi:uncharacterized protein YjbJ (UPF0337 family)
VWVAQSSGAHGASTQGEITMMQQSTKDKAEGSFHELKGTIKRKAGKLINDPGLEAEGVVEKIAGKIQTKVGQVEKAVETP